MIPRWNALYLHDAVLEPVSGQALAQFVKGSDLLDELAGRLLDTAQTDKVVLYHRPRILDLVSRWKRLLPAHLLDIASALAKMLSLEPAALPLAQRFLCNAPNFLDSVLLSKSPLYDVQKALLALYRLLDYDVKVFSTLVRMQLLWKWAKSPEPTVRMLALHCSDPIYGPYDEQEINLLFLPIYEARRINAHSESRRKADLTPPNPTSVVLSASDFCADVACVCGVLLLRQTSQPNTTSHLPFIETSTSICNLYAFVCGLAQAKSILITGPSGSGKTYMIMYVASILGYDPLFIHLGEQTDAKMLIGSYTCQRPGVFEWSPGILTRAVREGRWVVIEDLDGAPDEVVSLLLPLLERNELVVNGRGHIEMPTTGFRLISTSRAEHIRTLGVQKWNRINVRTPLMEELQQIIMHRFQIIRLFCPLLIRIFSSVQNLYGQHSDGTIRTSKLGRRPPSAKDLMKFCRRVENLEWPTGNNTPVEAASEKIYFDIFSEAIDCFAGSVADNTTRLELIRTIARTMEISDEKVDFYLENHIPAIKVSSAFAEIGRCNLPKKAFSRFPAEKDRPVALTRHFRRTLERLACSVKVDESLLLVGETGTGKTAAVQELATLLHQDLSVLNLSQQTEVSDLLGSFKPLNPKLVAVSLQNTFGHIFAETFHVARNETFLKSLSKAHRHQKWKKCVSLWKQAIDMASQRFSVIGIDERSGKKRRFNPSSLMSSWQDFTTRVNNFELNLVADTSAFVFDFVEGALTQAVRTGKWILLDEINLATSDTLEAIDSLLSDVAKSIVLTEKGTLEQIQAHPDFRLFACMNPATDIGKHDLPPGVRSRFTEFYITSPDESPTDLLEIVSVYLGHFLVGKDPRMLTDVTKSYGLAKQLSTEQRIVDGSGRRPHYSLRTLVRALKFVQKTGEIYGLRRSLFEGFCMSFLTVLNKASEALLLPTFESLLLAGVNRGTLKQIPKSPGEGYVRFQHYWIPCGTFEMMEQPDYIITPSVERNLLNIVRASLTRSFPVLLQGPTSSGKTSMIEYLARRTGHRFVRINNHDHTDLQEYLGGYVANDSGKLEFKEGVLVQALRNGDWLVLDELNLAPSDVLEALNRLLDDNRELYIPETQVVVRPHPSFMLFATQNPAGLYAGRKVLSRAFQSRFLELHIDDIPQTDLEIILRERCRLAPTYCSKIVEVYKQLSVERQTSRVFEEKLSFVTLRDLFRWAKRSVIGYQQLAENGYMLLAERVRNDEERDKVKSIIERVMRVRIDPGSLYNLETLPEFDILKTKLQNVEIVWTKAMRRVFCLVMHCLRNNEPVLLVGETGSGKTTVCQVIANLFETALSSVNAHQNLETGDLVGSQRPIRNRSTLEENLLGDLGSAFANLGIKRPEALSLTTASSIWSTVDRTDVDGELLHRIESQSRTLGLPFEWQDGPLISAMRSGSHFLLDEISLADDSVLERLNSLLEDKRRMFLAEKEGDSEDIIAEEGFQFYATMNPGSDHGKKELSPALRSRFTEIWVTAIQDLDDIAQIVSERFVFDARKLTKILVEFTVWFTQGFRQTLYPKPISIRDVSSWVDFINLTHTRLGLYASLYHGAALIFIDGLGVHASSSSLAQVVELEKAKCIKKLQELGMHWQPSVQESTAEIVIGSSDVAFGPFQVDFGPFPQPDDNFHLNVTTTATNCMRIARGLQLEKSLLLEGSPGVGKTTIISALASLIGFPLLRINLSEQTDLEDLFGCDVPLHDSKEVQFGWRDAPFLRAMQMGGWVLLDELNLAPQSVLEGLNACLDHRGEAYIPELDRTFHKHEKFRIFAAQNPHSQGGGRKGLPKSFTNRFNNIYIDSFTTDDMRQISRLSFPRINPLISAHIVDVIRTVEKDCVLENKFGSLGHPWEFNLRDVLRWHYAIESNYLSKNAIDFWDLIISQRFRSEEDKKSAMNTVSFCFAQELNVRPRYALVTSTVLQIGHCILPRLSSPLLMNRGAIPTTDSLHLLPVMESLLSSVVHNWPSLLVGGPGTGKTETVTRLASNLGHRLIIINLNKNTDSMDLIGSFEQRNFKLDCELFLKALQQKVFVLISHALTSSTDFDSARHGYIIDVADKVAQLLDSITHATIENTQSMLRELGPLIGCIYGTDSNISHSHQRLLESFASTQQPSFAWHDGPVLQAMEAGDWLLLENANLCSSSVLDRLNCLLEPNGFLAVNEVTQADGSPKILKPHQEFRVFVTVDPRYGEVSRAMRNRCTEIFFESKVHDGHSVPDLEYLESPIGLRKHTEMALMDQLLRVEWCCQNEAMCAVAVGNLTDECRPLVRQWAETVPQLNNSVKQSILEFSTLSRHPVYADIEETIEDTLRIQAPSYLRKVKDVFTSANMEAKTNFISYNRKSGLSSNATHASDHSTSLKVANDLMTIIEQAMTRLSILVDLKPLLSFLFDLESVLYSFALDLQWRPKSVGLVYSQAFKDLITKFLTVDYEVPSGFVPFLDKFAMLFDGFESACALRRGQNVEMIWKQLRPPVPINGLNETKIIELQNQIRAIDYSFDFIHPVDCRLFYELHLEEARLLLSLMSTDAVSLTELTQIFNKSPARNQTALDSTRLQQDLKQFRTAFDYFAQTEELNTLSASTEIQPSCNSVSLSRLAGRDLLQIEMSFCAAMSQSKPELLMKWNTKQEKNFFKSLWQTENKTMFTHRKGPIDLIKDSSTVAFFRSIANLRSVPVSSLSSAKSALELLGVQMCRTAVHKEITTLSYFFRLLGLGLRKLCALHSSTFLQEDSAKLIELIEQSYMKVTAVENFPGHAVREEVFSLMLTSKDANFCSATQRYFKHTILFAPESEIEVDYFAVLGRGFFNLAMGGFNLYVPDKPVDPAMFSNVASQIQGVKESFLSSQMQGRIMYDCVVFGHEVSPSIAILRSKLQGVTTKLPMYNVRHDRSDFNALWQNMNDFVEMMISHSTRLEKSATMLVDVIPSRIEKMEERFSDYADVLDPFSYFAYQLNLGISLSDYASRCSSSSIIHSTILQLSAPTFLWSESSALVMDAISSLSPQGNTNESLVSILLCKASQIMGSYDLSYPKFEMYESMVNEYAETLKFREMRTKADYEKNSSLYKYKSPDDSETEKAELESLFPGEADNLPKSSANSSSQVIDCYLMLMLAKNNEAFIDIAIRISDFLVKEIDLFEELDDKKTFIYQIIAFSRVSSEFSKPDQDLDFYHSANPSRSLEASDLASKVRINATALVHKFPENFVLLDIMKACDAVLMLPITVTLYKALQKLEQLHITLDEWEKSASRDDSLASDLGMARVLIIKWRRLELKSWRSLLDREYRSTEVDSQSWWHKVYELCVSTPRELAKVKVLTPDYIIEMTRALIEYLQTSTYGQVGHRLRHLRALKSHLIWMSQTFLQTQLVASALDNILSFFELYTSIVNAQLKELRAKLERDISEIILLATWKDANLHALQESSGQSHRKLLKIVQHYRNFLQQPVFSLIVAGLPVERAESNSKSDTSNNRRFVVQKKTASQLISLNAEPASHKSLNFLGVTIVSIAEDCREIMTMFRKETSLVDMKKDSNLLGQLRLRKHRALVDTMKLLSKIGYKSRPRFDTIQSHMNITSLLTSAVPIGDVCGTEKDFFQIIELLPRIRERAASTKGDLTTVEVSRGLGLCDSLVEALFEARRPIFRLAEAMKCLEELLEGLRKIGNLHLQKASICGIPKMDQYSSYIKLFRQLPAMMKFTKHMFDIYDSISEHRIAQDLHDGMIDMASSTSEMSSRFAQFTGVCSSLDEENYNMARSKVRTALSWVQKNIWEPPLSFLASQLCSLMETLNRFEDLQYEAIEPINREKISLLSQDITSKMMQALQNLHVESQKLPVTIDEDGSMLRTASFYCNSPDTIGIIQINQMIGQLMAQFNSLSSCDVIETEHLSHAVFLLLPTAERFFGICTTLLHNMSVHHHESSRATFDLLVSFFKLCSEGFCLPNEAESQSANAKKQNGTGFGDAENGADENISRDVADDEDLSVGDENSDRGSLGADEDGVEMEENFDGELEDIDGSVDEDGEDKGSDGSYADQVDNISNDDENAIDEKLWSQDTGDEQPEKGNAKTANSIAAEQNGSEEPDLKRQDENQQKQHKPHESEENHDDGDDTEEHENGLSEEDSELETQMPMDDRLPIDSNVEESERFELPDLSLDDKSESEADFDNQSQQDDLMSEKGSEFGDLEENETKISYDSEEHNEDLPSHNGDDGQDQAFNDAYEDTRPDESPDSDMELQENGFGQDDRDDSRLEQQKATGPNNSTSASEIPEQSKQTSLEAANLQEEDGQGSSNPALQGDSGESDERQQTRRSLAQTTEALRAHIHSLAEASAQEDPSKKLENDFEHVDEENPSNAQVMASAQESRAEGADATPFAQSQSHDASLQKGHPSNPVPGSPEQNSNNEQDIRQMEIAKNDHVWQDWGFHERSTKDLSFVLCEQLRMILEPTLASRMQGDYRTGKRLNMRRIIPYIASEYKKDKIWLRRSKPSKRQYQVLLAIDDSRSMADSGCADLAFDTLALVAQAMAQLEVGEIGFLKFGEKARVLHALGDPYTSDVGARIIEQFAFAEERTNVKNLLEQSVEVFEAANSRGDVWQLEIIISDGLCENHDEIARILRRARDGKILFVFAVLDRGDNPITHLKRVTWVGGEMQMDRYLDTFPFEYYVVVRHIEELPTVLSSVLRQFFQLS